MTPLLDTDLIRVNRGGVDYKATWADVKAGVPGGPPAYDPDAQDYITRVEAVDGQALEDAAKDVINQFVLDLKASSLSLWSNSIYIHPLIGPRTLAGAMEPLKGGSGAAVNSYTAGDYDRAKGPLGNSTNKYITTTYDDVQQAAGGDIETLAAFALATEMPLATDSSYYGFQVPYGPQNYYTRRNEAGTTPRVVTRHWTSSGNSSPFTFIANADHVIGGFRVPIGEGHGKFLDNQIDDLSAVTTNRSPQPGVLLIGAEADPPAAFHEGRICLFMDTARLNANMSNTLSEMVPLLKNYKANITAALSP